MGIGVPLTFKEVAEILKLIDASECEEVILELEGTRLVVRRNSGGGASVQSAAPARAEAASAPASTGNIQAAPAAPASGAAPSAEPGTTDVRAPMVGTFYRRPSPDEAVFVEEGATVKKGQPLCLIEVMKLFTTIEAPADGTVVAIAPEDGALVEYNQLLFQIRS